MNFADEIYVDPSLSKGYQKLMEQIRDEEIPLSCFLIARPASDLFPFIIYPAYVLKEKYYRESEDTVGGIASSKDEAMKLAGELAVLKLRDREKK